MTAEPVYIRAAEVAERFQVSPKTVTRWANAGKLSYLRTLGGHRRYPEAEIARLVAARSNLETDPQDEF